MSKRVKAFIVKFIGVGVLTFGLYGIFYHATIGRLLLMTIVIVGISFIGDLFILPRINLAVAAVADFVGYFLLYWLLGNLVVDIAEPLLLPALTAALFGGLAEMVYHIYVMDRLHEPPRTAPIPTRFQTEFAEEPDPKVARQKKKAESEEKH